MIFQGEGMGEVQNLIGWDEFNNLQWLTETIPQLLSHLGSF